MQISKSFLAMALMIGGAAAFFTAVVLTSKDGFESNEPLDSRVKQTVSVQKMEVGWAMPGDWTSNLMAAYGDFNFTEGNYKAAEEEFKMGIVSDPNNLKNYRGLGAIRFNQKRYPEAQELFEFVLRRDKDHLEALVNLGKIHFLDGKYEKGIGYLCQANEIDPSEDYIIMQLVEMYRHYGAVLNNQGKSKEAIEIMKKVSRISRFEEAILSQILSYEENLEKVTINSERSKLLAAEAHYILASSYHVLVEFYCGKFADTNQKSYMEKAKEFHQKAISGWLRTVKLNPSHWEAKENLDKLKVK